MLLEVGIMFAAYVGVRVYESYRQESQRPSPKVGSAKKTALADTIINATENEHKHYFIMSTISLKLAVVRQILPAFAPVSLAFYIYTHYPHLKYVEKLLVEEKRVDSYTLSVAGGVLVLATGHYFTAALGVWILHTTTLLVAKRKTLSKQQLNNAFEQPQCKVWVLKDDIEVEIPLEEVNVNDIVVVNSGEMVPVDGVITRGIAIIDQQTLTGKAQPIEKGIGAQILASSIVIAGKILVQVESSGQLTTMAQLCHTARQSIDFNSTIEFKGEKWANRAVAPMLGIAGVILPILGPNATFVFMKSHIGDEMRLLASLSAINYMTVASHKGIMVKDGHALEELKHVDTILFDKTGTLTDENPAVGQIIVCGAYSEEEILRWAATAERRFSHPIANAILNKAEQANLTLPDEGIEDSQYRIGYGIELKLEHRLIQVGSLSFMAMEGLAIPQAINEVESDIHRQGSTLVLVAVNRQVIGAIEIQAQVRAEVKQIIRELRQLSHIKHIAVISGDHQQPTQKLAEELGMDSYYSEILPENKAKIVEQLRQAGRTVCFVGDGVNDVMAMRSANVSISLHGSATVTTDVAPLVLMDGSLSMMVELFELSKQLDTNLRNTMIITMIPSVANLSGAFLLHFSPLTSILVSFGFSLVGFGNTMLPLKGIPLAELINKEKLLNKDEKPVEPILPYSPSASYLNA